MNMHGLPAFLMSRICERGARNFGRQSRRGELYAAAVLGILTLLLMTSVVLILHAWVPNFLELRSAILSRFGLISIWIAATVIAYALLVPGRRYHRWSDEFKSRHAVAREKPGMVEALSVGVVLALLIASIALNWLKHIAQN